MGQFIQCAGGHQEEHHEGGTRVEYQQLSLHQALVACCFLRKQRSEAFLDLRSSSKPMATIARPRCGYVRMQQRVNFLEHSKCEEFPFASEK